MLYSQILFAVPEFCQAPLEEARRRTISLAELRSRTPTHLELQARGPFHRVGPCNLHPAHRAALLGVAFGTQSSSWMSLDVRFSLLSIWE